MDYYSLETGYFELNIESFSLTNLLDEIQNIMPIFAELKQLTFKIIDKINIKNFEIISDY